MKLHFPYGHNYDCVQCGRSCSYYGTIPVEDRVVETLSQHPLGLRVAETHGSAFHKRDDGTTVMHMVAAQDPTCVYLDQDKLCKIHAELGAAAKPTTCQQYPFQFTSTPDGLFVGASFFCTSIRENSGRPMYEHSLEILENLLPQAIITQVPDPIPLDSHRTLSWEQYRQLESRFHQLELDQACAQLAEENGFTPLLDVAEFSAFKLLLSLPAEADAAYGSGAALPIPASSWQGSWSDLKEAKNHAYDRQLEAWARMYMHRKLLALHRPLQHNLWSLILIPRLIRLTTALWPHEGQFWTSLEQAEILLGSRGRALDPLAAQFSQFLARR